MTGKYLSGCRNVSLHVLIAALMVAILLISGCGSTSDPEINTVHTGTGESTTVRQDNGAGAYVFAVMGDSHTDGLDNGILSRAISSAIDNGAAFIIHTGDVSNIGADSELQRYRDFIDTVAVPVYSIPGNHDVVAGDGSAPFARIVGPPYSSFDFQGDHFVLADNSDEALGIDSEQMEMLASDLSANRGKPHQFIFTHIPLGESLMLPEEYLGEQAQFAGRQLVLESQQYGNITGFFSGHVHGFLKYRLGEVDAWVSGGAGAQPYPADIIGYYHYLLVAVDGDVVDVEVVRL